MTLLLASLATHAAQAQSPERKPHKEIQSAAIDPLREAESSISSGFNIFEAAKACDIVGTGNNTVPLAVTMLASRGLNGAQIRALAVWMAEHDFGTHEHANCEVRQKAFDKLVALVGAE